MITHPADIQNAATDAVVDSVDAAATAGKLLLLTAADATLATKELSDPAFGAAAAGVAALAGTPLSATASGAGTVAKFSVTDGDDTPVFAGTAGPANAITGVSTAAKTLSVAADLSAVLSAGSIVRVSGSTGNDGHYTVVSAVYGAPTTVITVVEAVPDATVDGTLHPFDLTIDNPALVAGQTVVISSHTYRALKA